MQWKIHLLFSENPIYFCWSSAPCSHTSIYVVTPARLTFSLSSTGLCFRAPHTQLCSPTLCSGSLSPPELNTGNTGDLGGCIPQGTGISPGTLTGGWRPGRCQEPRSGELTLKPLCQMAWVLSVVRAALYFLALLMRREHFELSKPPNLVSLAHEQQQHTVEHNNKRERAVELYKNLNLRVCSSELEALAVLFPGIGWVMFENNG